MLDAVGVERMNIQNIYEELSKWIPKSQLFLNEPMKKHTSFKIGGPADLLVVPSSGEQIKCTLQICRDAGVPVFTMGNGSNLLVKDKGIRGVVLKICENFSQLWMDGTLIRAQAGVLLSALSRAALDAHLAGLEFASGIPGTLGGAIFMNAGAYGGEMKDVTEWVWAIDMEGHDYRLSKEELKFGYRSSVIQEKGLIVLEAGIRLTPGDYEKSKALIADLTKRRQEKQPLQYPSAGSTFKRPPGYYAGKLIQDAGLKGARIGDAQVSELHSGFIINLGNATAQDVLDLIKLIQERVKEKFGVDMQPEVRIVGE